MIEDHDVEAAPGHAARGLRPVEALGAQPRGVLAGLISIV